jgi:hypothetical protein
LTAIVWHQAILAVTIAWHRVIMALSGAAEPVDVAGLVACAALSPILGGLDGGGDDAGGSLVLGQAADPSAAIGQRGAAGADGDGCGFGSSTRVGGGECAPIVSSKMGRLVSLRQAAPGRRGIRLRLASNSAIVATC